MGSVDKSSAASPSSPIHNLRKDQHGLVPKKNPYNTSASHTLSLLMHPRSLSDKDLVRLQAHIEATGSAKGFVPTPPKKRKNEEWRIQSYFFRWWRGAAKGLGVWPGFCYHIPNGSMLGDDANSRVIRARMLALAGLVPGVPDVFLGVARGKWAGMYVEFKKPGVRNHKNGGCSDEQQEFLAYAMAHGYHCAVCYSWEEGRDRVVEYLKFMS